MPGSDVKAIPDGINTVTPHLICRDAAKAIAFYKKAFEAEEMFLLDGPDGKVMHACVRIGNSSVMLADEFPEWDSLGPLSRAGTTVSMHVYVENPDAMFDRAVASGAKVIMPMGDAFWGDRYGQVEDPFGHRWAFACHQRDVSIEEMKEAMLSMPQCAPDQN
jgi:PhnB protein